MITPPGCPIGLLQITRSSSSEDPHFLKEILLQRLAISTNNGNISQLISTLEDYLNIIYSNIINSQEIDYLQVLVFSETIIFHESIPWNLPFTKNKKQTWKLSNEIIIVLINLVLSYNQRSSEIIAKALDPEENKILSEKELQQLWLNSFKLYKKSLLYINFLKLNNNETNSIFETSINFIEFINHLTLSSIQLTFLSKSIWTLKSLNFDLNLKNNLNFSTLSRIAIFIKDEIKLMVNSLKSENVNSSWLLFLENLNQLVNSYIGTLLSIENYKLDQIGKSIGFLNMAIESLSKKSTDNDEFENDSKLKKKLLTLKKKLDKPKSTLKLNNKIIESFNPCLKQSTADLFELIKILNLKYNLENNNLKFDQILNSVELFKNHLPTGRSVPISNDDSSWIPEISNLKSTENNQYY